MKTDLDRQLDSDSILFGSSSEERKSTQHRSWSELNILNSLEYQLKILIKDRADRGEYVEAIALLDRLISLCPDNAAYYNNRGLMYWCDARIIEALCDLSIALEIDPDLDSAYNNRGNCHAARGDLAEAIADYDRALDLNPANLRAWINQGIAFRELGMYDLALENFDITLIIGDSLRSRIYRERGRTYHLRGDWNCAVADYRAALKILVDSNSSGDRQKIQGWLDELLHPLAISDR